MLVTKNSKFVLNNHKVQLIVIKYSSVNKLIIIIRKKRFVVNSYSKSSKITDVPLFLDNIILHSEINRGLFFKFELVQFANLLNEVNCVDLRRFNFTKNS